MNVLNKIDPINYIIIMHRQKKVGHYMPNACINGRLVKRIESQQVDNTNEEAQTTTRLHRE